ncbi:MAG: hypothetical protein KKB21_03020 [Nanoarchaeota archaeon]|nr:hypothetical protein [Nanoarchaeota archaeon]MBU4086524.1 hypothetical protein [Nanoarchaeota archaeon]
MGLLDLFRKKKPVSLPDGVTISLPSGKSRMPLFNLDVRGEHRIPGERLEEKDFGERFNSFATGYWTVFSDSSISQGIEEGLAVYEAELERYFNGSPANIHFDCGKGIGNYPYRVIRGHDRFNLTGLCIGQEKVDFGTTPHRKVA